VVFTSTQSDGADAYVYDTATGQWSTAPLSLARLVQDTVTVGHDALLVGGNAAGQTVANVDVYDGDTGQWSTAMLSEARGGFATAVSGNVAVFAAGGIPSPTDAVDLFNATTGQWTSGHLSVARFGVQAVAVGSLVVLAGGTDSHGTSQAVDVYNARTGRWYASQMPNGSLSVGIAMGNKAVFGVQEPLHLPSSADIQDPGRAEVLDISTGTWTQLKLGWRFTPTAAYPTARGVMLTASDTDGTYDGYVGDELIATNDRPPVPLDPRPGATVSSATEVFRWSAVPGATSYTVYINDDTATYQLPATRLPLTALNTIDIGSRNTIQIVANFPHGQTVSGDRYSFGSNFPDVRVTVASSGIPGGTLTPASTWTVKADVLNNYISRWTGPLRIEAYASSDGTLNGPLRLLGSATTTHVLLGATASVSIPVSLSAFAAVKGTTRATLLLVAEPLVPGRRRVPPRNVYSTAIGDSFSVKA
jgi:hypothetical protein